MERSFTLFEVDRNRSYNRNTIYQKQSSINVPKDIINASNTESKRSNVNRSESFNFLCVRPSISLKKKTSSQSNSAQPSIVDEENQELKKMVETLKSQIQTNKIFLYMVIHDLKHPTESMIS